MTRSCHLFIWMMLIWPSWQLLAQVSTTGFYQIPAQQFNNGSESDPDIANSFMKRSRAITVSLTDFSISRQISLKEYRQFVTSQPAEKYDLLRPDTSITHTEAYRAYWETDDYDEYPAVGISWDNAMAYCQWRTLEEQQAGSYSYYYTLPTYYQWIGAFRQLDSKRKKHDFNKDYADWLLHSHPITEYSFLHDLNPDLSYQEDKVELLKLQHSSTIGASYHRQIANIRDYPRVGMTKKKGYPDVGFRIVKVMLPATEEEQSAIDNYFIKLWQLR